MAYVEGKLDYNPDGSDWHESGIPVERIVEREFDFTCTRLSDIQEKEYQKLVADNKLDYVMPLERGGKDWLIAPLKQWQPQSHAVLAEHASEYHLGLRWWDSFMRDPPELDSLSVVSWLEVCERVIELEPRKPTYEDNYPLENFYLKDSLASLPTALAQSWQWRAGGWRIASSIPGGLVNRQLIGCPSSQWLSIGGMLRSYHRTWEKKYLPIVLEQVPDAVVTHYNPEGKPSQWHALRCFLDTRPEGLLGPCGDQLFVVDEHTDQVVYHIHDGDFKHIRVLHNPAEAVDAYCAHTLLRTPRRFDFMPWSEPLK